MKPKIIRNGEGTIYATSPTERLTFKISSADTNDLIDYGEATIGYLDGPPLHIHHNQDELFHVLEGELHVQVGEERIDLGPGDCAFCPRGIPHTFTNLKREPVRVIGVILGGGFDRFMAEFASLIAQKPEPAKLAEVSAKHNIEFVGPPLWA